MLLKQFQYQSSDRLILLILILKDLQVIDLEGRKKIEQDTTGKDKFFKNISNVSAYKLIASKIKDIMENENQ